MKNSLVHSPFQVKDCLKWRTIRFFVMMSLANEPFVALYALAPFILRKELSASIFELTVLSSIRPFLSLLSLYWSSSTHETTEDLRKNVIWTWVFARISFLFVPVFPSSLYFIFCCVLYELFKKAGTPVLIELLRNSIPEGLREKSYSICYALTFIEGIFCGAIIGNLAYSKFFMWKEAFAITASLSLVSAFAYFSPFYPSNKKKISRENTFSSRVGFPWKSTWILLRENPDFFRFQTGFMMGGIGLMLVAPVLPLLYVDRLNLSLSEITIARSTIMGLGIVGSFYFWTNMILQKKIDRLLISILSGFFVYLLLSYLSAFFGFLFYASNLMYGIAQAGSHLLWNLSGPLFSGQKDSTSFSRANVLMVGLRGIFIPALGGGLNCIFGPLPVLLLGALFCLLGIMFITITSKKAALKTSSDT